MLMVGNAVATAFGGLLAFSIAGIKSSNGYQPWRWIFIIEGCITAGVTLFVYPFMSDWPRTSKWLSDSERAILSDKSKSTFVLHEIGRLIIISERGSGNWNNHNTQPKKYQTNCFRLEDLCMVSLNSPLILPITINNPSAQFSLAAQQLQSTPSLSSHPRSSTNSQSANPHATSKHW